MRYEPYQPNLLAGVRLLCIGLAFMGGFSQTWVSAAESPPLANLSFEQLSQIEIITASKRPEALANTPAAVYVLTGEDIHRLGASTLPDALRYVPGVEVAAVNSSQWGVSVRGFNGQFANLLLVMMDGRSIYSPAFGGVDWCKQNLVFDDIDRIEVVRGPGGTLWGANAVNGVINILTKSARDTQGLLVRAGGGTFTEAIVETRYGFKLSDNTFGRVYGKYDRFGEAPLASGGDTPDDWRRWQSGFRLDSEPSDTATFTLQGDVYQADAGSIFPFPTFTPPTYTSLETYRIVDTGVNVLGRWTRHFSPDSALTAQAYFDYVQRLSPTAHQHLYMLDADVQHAINWGERQQITWGAGYRVTLDTFRPSRTSSTPGREQANDQLFSLFAQDELAVVREKVFLTLGSKVEHNDYTGWELSPSARLRWHPTEQQTVWGAVSRAVATPNHMSTGIAQNLRVLPPGILMQLQGHADRSEELLAYEIGYRIQPVKNVSVDLATFYNDYSDLLITEAGAIIPGTPPILPVNWVNRIDGHTYGLEVALGWQPLQAWRLQGSYTWFESSVARASVGRGDGGSSPRHQFSARSIVDFGSHWEWDTGLRFVDELESIQVPSYVELDVRLAWKPNPRWEVAVVGQNLLDTSHFEYPRGLSPLQSEVPRSVYGTITWRF